MVLILTQDKQLEREKGVVKSSLEDILKAIGYIILGTIIIAIIRGIIASFLHE